MNTVANLNNIVLYQNENGNKIVEVLYDSEDFWLTQKTMAELFSVKVNTINYHLKEIFDSGELEEDSVIRKIRITANDGKKYNTSFYSLDAIIAVGYRVNSFEAIQYRKRMRFYERRKSKIFISTIKYGYTSIICKRKRIWF